RLPCQQGPRRAGSVAVCARSASGIGPKPQGCSSLTTPRDNGEQLVRNGALLAHIRNGNLDAGADRSRRIAEGHPVVAVEDAVEPRSIIEVRDAPPAAVTLDCRDLEADPLVGR